MARCDQGYLCRVCKDEVEHVTESELYLLYVIGEMDPEKLHVAPECHLGCNPILSQFIDDPRFSNRPIVDGPFARDQLDPAYAKARAELITRGYGRLWEIRTQRKEKLTVLEYPLPEFLHKWK